MPRQDSLLRRFPLRFEQLEDRSMMAGITANLSTLGVLTITGTTGNDTITVHRQSTKFTIDTVAGNFDTTKVKSIIINTGAGTDKVTLDNGGKSAASLGVSVTINSGGGNDTTRLTDGRDVYFTGTTTALTFDTAGAAKVNSKAVTWFDTHVQDAALRALANTDFTDGVLSRNDMMGLLRQAETSGSMTTSLLTDLKAIVNNTALFNGVSYVQTLASDVVNGNAANAKYLGQSLGNLAVGSSAAQLEKLVQKWFLGGDHPTGKSDWGPTYAYAQASGQLFVGGVAYTDVNQGGCGDCYFLTSLAETALKNPNAITSMFIVNGDGTYTVRFYNGSKADYVTVDSQLPVDSYGRLVFAGMGRQASSAGELWVALAEKAYVQMNASGWLRPSSMGGGQNSYAGISGGYIYQALGQITGQATSWASLSTSDAAFTSFATAFNAGKMMGLSSVSNPNNSAIVGGHAYAVVSVNVQAKTVTVYNPWGMNNGTQYAGLVTLSWSTITGSFGWVDRTA